MSKLTIQKMSFYYTDFYHPVFQNVNLVLDTDWKLGLIGRNGRGKTTFLHLLSKKVQPTAGRIDTSVQMCYFPLELEIPYQNGMDWMKEAVGHLKSMEEQMESILMRQDSALFDIYCNIQQEYQEMGGYEMEGSILREVASIGLDPSILQRNRDTLSGGEQTKMALCAMFLRKDSFLLLDEPTNHLDTKGKEDLANYLKVKRDILWYPMIASFWIRLQIISFPLIKQISLWRKERIPVGKRTRNGRKNLNWRLRQSWKEKFDIWNGKRKKAGVDGSGKYTEISI